MPSRSSTVQSVSMAARPRRAWPRVRLAQPPGPSAVTGARVADVPTGQLGQRLVLGVVRARRHPLVEGGVGLLLALHRAADQHLVVLGVHQDEAEPHPAGRHPGRLQGSGEILSGAVVPVPHRLGENVLRSAQLGGVEAVLPGVGRHHPAQLRRGQPEQPADVLGDGEMPGRAQHVGAQDGAVVEGLQQVVAVGRVGHPLGNGPQGIREFLGLHRDERPDNAGDVGRQRLPRVPGSPSVARRPASQLSRHSLMMAQEADTFRPPSPRGSTCPNVTHGRSADFSRAGSDRREGVRTAGGLRRG